MVGTTIGGAINMTRDFRGYSFFYFAAWAEACAERGHIPFAVWIGEAV